VKESFDKEKEEISVHISTVKCEVYMKE